MDDEPFNPDYVEVDRILEYSCCEDTDTGEVSKCKSIGRCGQKHPLKCGKSLDLRSC